MSEYNIVITGIYVGVVLYKDPLAVQNRKSNSWLAIIIKVPVLHAFTDNNT